MVGRAFYLYGLIWTACVLLAGGAHAIPSLSFGLITYKKFELNQHCAAELSRAQEIGFDTVAVIPAFAFNQLTSQIENSELSVDGDELVRCFDLAWKAGFNIIYDPHIETWELINNLPQAPWRAKLKFHPDQKYLAIYQTLLDWLREHSAEIRSSRHTVKVILASEYEASTTLFPLEWLQFNLNFKNALNQIGLKEKVQVGYDPNWFPMNDPTRDQCRNFKKFVGSFDFLAPSFYGDWSKLELGSKQIELSKALMFSRFEFRGASCFVWEFAFLPFSIGEFGTGAVLSDSVTNHVLKPADPGYIKFQKDREVLYHNLLQWMQTSGSGSSFVNLWTSGIFDPVGLTSDVDTVDPAIVSEFQKYHGLIKSKR